MRVVPWQATHYYLAAAVAGRGRELLLPLAKLHHQLRPL
jgi:hypothetical protein